MKGAVFGVIFIPVVFIRAGGLTEEGHVTGAAEGVASNADRLGHVLPLALRRRQGRSPDSGGERAGEARPISGRGRTKVHVKEDCRPICEGKSIIEFSLPSDGFRGGEAAVKGSFQPRGTERTG